METFKNDRTTLEMVVMALGLCAEAMRTLKSAIEDVRQMLPETAVPPAQRAHVDARIRCFGIASGKRLNDFVTAAASHIDRTFPPHLINHIVQSYEFGGPMCVPNLTWVLRLSEDFREEWATDLFKQAKPQFETN